MKKTRTFIILSILYLTAFAFAKEPIVFCETRYLKLDQNGAISENSVSQRVKSDLVKNQPSAFKIEDFDIEVQLKETCNNPVFDAPPPGVEWPELPTDACLDPTYEMYGKVKVDGVVSESSTHAEVITASDAPYNALYVEIERNNESVDIACYANYNVPLDPNYTKEKN